MSRHDPKVRLLHMRDFADKAVALAQGKTKESLETDEILRLALTHLIELVGEAASQIPREIQDQYPRIPWHKIIGMRNRLIHGYDFVDVDVLWNAIHLDLPSLAQALNEVLLLM